MGDLIFLVTLLNILLITSKPGFPQDPEPVKKVGGHQCDNGNEGQKVEETKGIRRHSMFWQNYQIFC